MIRKGRQVAENNVMPRSSGSSNDIMKQATENKAEKITGKSETVH